MQFLFLNWRDISHPRAGGAEQLTENIMAELAKRGHESTLLCPGFPGGKREEQRSGYRILRQGNQLTVRWYAWRLWRKEFSQRRIPLIRGTQGGFHDDIICIDQFHGLPFFTPFYIPRRQSLAIIYELAGDLWRINFFWPVSFAGETLEKMSLWFYLHRRFVAICQSTKDDLIKHGIPANDVSIIPVHINFNPLPVPSFNKKDPVVIHLGRIAPVKNIEDTIAACLKLRQSIPQLKLWLVGSGQGQYFDKIRRLAEQYNDFIVMHGFVSEEKKRDLLSEAKVLVATSHKEGYGLNVLEAAACGTPSVAYNVGGLREAIIDGQTGMLTGQNTPEDLVRQFQKILTDDRLYQDFARKAWQRSHEFSAKKTADAFEVAMKNFNLAKTNLA